MIERSSTVPVAKNLKLDYRNSLSCKLLIEKSTTSLLRNGFLVERFRLGSRFIIIIIKYIIIKPPYYRRFQ